MAALVAALLTQASDRTPWAAAVLGDRHPKKGAVVAAAFLALAVGNALGVVGGIVVAPLLSPNAGDLLLAVALCSGGITAFWPSKPPKVQTLGIGAFAGSLWSIGLLGFGDRMQFMTAAFAARSDTPALAAVGATFGAFAILVPAIMLGERGLRPLPTDAVRVGAAALLTVAGAVQGLSALRLI